MADERRLTVNPESLKVVDARPGGPAPDRGHVLAVKLVKAAPGDGYNFGRISVHREDCPCTPHAEGWTVKAATRDEISWMLTKADETTEIDVQVSISCRTCGGWSSLP